MVEDWDAAVADPRGCAVADAGYRAAGFISEWWPTSDRNTGRLRVGIGGRLPSESAKLRDELLNGEVFYTLKEACVVIEQWRRHYNTIRSHSSLGYQPPAPEVVIWPTEPTGSAPLARPAIVTRPTMH